MLDRDLLSARFVASVLMVDFANPIFSPARQRLLRYVPEDADLDPPHSLETSMVDAITAAARDTAPDSPEHRFLQNWALADSWQQEFGNTLTNYLSSVITWAQTEDGVDDYTRLAESRRREFRGSRLFEFSLALPTTNIPPSAPLLQMQPDGTITTKET